MKTTTFLFHCSLVLAAANALATTVAYWPLAYENGVRTTTATVFANQGNGGTLNAMPISIGSNGSVATILEENSDYCPQGTNAFPVGYGVYDPISGTRTPTPTGLYFHKTSLSAAAGGLRIADPLAGTVETLPQTCVERIAPGVLKLRRIPLRDTPLFLLAGTPW